MNVNEFSDKSDINKTYKNKKRNRVKKIKSE